MVSITFQAESLTHLQEQIRAFLPGEPAPEAPEKLVRKAAPKKAAETAPVQPEEAPTYTLEQVREKLNAIRLSKGAGVIRDMLSKLGCNSLVDVAPEQYPALMEAANAAE